MTTGTVYWFTGLSGAGKSTLGSAFYQKLRRIRPAVVYLDGDALRSAVGDDLGYDSADRLRCAMRYARLCKLIADQGVDVVITTISMFHQARTWNRRHNGRYREIYVRVPITALIDRDPNGTYRRAIDGETKHVYGIDLPIEEPSNPDEVIDNEPFRSPDSVADTLLERFGLSTPKDPN